MTTFGIIALIVIIGFIVFSMIKKAFKVVAFLIILGIIIYFAAIYI